MSKFSDLLSKPLPSAANKVITESCNEETEGLDVVNTATPVEEPVAPVSPVTPEEPVSEPVPTPTPAPVVSDDVATDLTPEESKRIDDTLNVVATPILLKDELGSEDEIKEFVESVDADVAEAEGFLTERTIVKFDKNAKRAQLYEVALFTVAREKKDPLYRKLETVYKMKRILKAKLRKKYHAQATAKMKEYLARAKKSKSGILARIAAKISGK